MPPMRCSGVTLLQVRTNHDTTCAFASQKLALIRAETVSEVKGHARQVVLKR